MAPTQDSREELRRARANTDALFHLIDPGAMYDRPIAERHRIIFYLGHLEAFDWDLIGRRHLDLPALDGTFDQLFERGIDPEPGKLPADEPADWPRISQVETYNAKARERVDDRWDSLPLDIRRTAIEHREMHAETLAYILHNLPLEKKVPPRETPPPLTSGSTENRQLAIPQGQATLGRDGGFGWDNEFRAHGIHVPAFSMARLKVTNREFLEFMGSTGAAAPHYWVARDGHYLYRAMFADLPLPLDWPVYVTQQQAAAYARWRGKSLPSEAQFHRAAYGTPGGEEQEYPWGAVANGHGNFNYRRWDPVPVNANPESDSALGVSQLVGNGWEWTSTVFGPFEGFEPRPYYPGYSADFFDNRHFVLKGASARTAASLTRRSFRNWFRPEYPYVYAGFRLVEN